MFVMGVDAGPSHLVTDLLIQWSRGKREVSEQLLPIVYKELRRLAASYLRRERPGHTLDSTALVHEAYMRLVDQRKVEWRDRAHFFGVAANLMRRILVDHARRRRVGKRGGGRPTLHLNGDVIDRSLDRAPDLTALDDALNHLAEVDPDQSRIVELRFFAGMTHHDIAGIMEVSVPTVERRWRMARAWLFDYMNSTAPRTT